MATIPVFSLAPAAQLFSGLSAAVPLIGIGIGTAVTVKFIIDNKDEVERMINSLTNTGGGRSTSTSPRVKERVWSSKEYLEILTKKHFEELVMVMSHAHQISIEIPIEGADLDIKRAHVVSLVRNAQPRKLKLYHYGSFSGKFLGPPPVFLVQSPIFIGLFVHQGCKDDGSKGYVIYGTNDDDGPPLLYILGWSKPAKGSPKVYVQAGLLPNMLKQQQPKVGKWDDVVKNQLIDLITQKFNGLIEAHQCSSYDPETGAEAEADIRSVIAGSSWAVLGAKFFRRQR